MLKIKKNSLYVRDTTGALVPLPLVISGAENELEIITAYAAQAKQEAQQAVLAVTDTAQQARDDTTRYLANTTASAKAQVEKVVATIPADYTQLTQEVSALPTDGTIANTVSGNPVTITDGAEKPILTFTMFGRSDQIGTPTVAAPIGVSHVENAIVTVSGGGTSNGARINKVLRGLPVESGGNYVDKNGQHWDCDVLRIFPDGTGEIERRVGVKGITASVGGAVNMASNHTFYINRAFLENEMLANTTQGDFKVFSNAMTFHQTSTSTSLVDSEFIIAGTAKTTIIFRLDSASTWAEALAALVAANTEFIFPLATITTEALTKGDTVTILNLKTHTQETTISNNADTGMEITYQAGTKAYIDRKFQELRALITG